jgi:hypothetical protein|tara:strand:- start:2101 stop:2988 length:888 start_codon:yes stop_codon:yes gene_type:complete
MKSVFTAVAAVLIPVIGISLASPSYAADKLNLLIMGEDADKDTVPRNSRVFKRVLDALSNQLHDEGFDVFDETAVTLENFAQGRVRRTDAELIDIARSVKRPPIDVMVMFGIYASARELSYTTKVKTRVSGRMLQVQTGQRLGNFEVESPKQWNAPKSCSRECLLEVVGKNSRILASDIGAVLAEKLASLEDGDGEAKGGGSALSQGYTIIFDGFSTDDMIDIEEYIVVFRGYKNHRPISETMRQSEIWYETTSGSARLTRNLKKMIQRIGVSARVAFSGNEYSVKKITKRKRRN